MTREERKKFENLNSSYNKYWVPCVWFSNLAAQARREGRIRDNSALKLLLEVGWRGCLRVQGEGWLDALTVMRGGSCLISTLQAAWSPELCQV